ncbi:MAG TPA: EAL domain-containing protein [Wenzhouxiangella sp.]|nr:EAL domain-containing protein [Wenzhouxiangella sp.]
MAKPPSKLNILAVSHDPSAPRQLMQMLDDDDRVNVLFADTANAVQRVFQGDRVDMVLIRMDPEDPALFQACVRMAREQEGFVPVMALVDTDDAQSALAAAAAGVEGFVSQSGLRQFKRLALSQVESLLARQDARQALKSLEDIEDRYTLLLHSSSEAIAYLHEGLHIYANPAYLELFGFGDFDDLEGLSMLDLLSSGEKAIDLKQVLKDLNDDKLPEDELELQAHRQDGENFIALVDFSPARYGGEYCAQMLVRKQVAMIDPAMEQELQRLKTRDRLTDLLNAPAFIELVGQKLSAKQEDEHLAILAIALDNREEMLDKVGIGASDELVRETAELLRDVIGDEHELARLRDHTFVMSVSADSRADIDKLAGSITENTSGRIIDVRDNSLTISVGVGLAITGSEPPEPATLAEQAESALVEALRAGGGSFVRYRPRVSFDDDENLAAWEERLRHALDQDEFSLVVLPVTSMEDDSFLINEIETRLRPEDSDEVILPSAYMGAAARAGLATRLDEDMLDRLEKLVSESSGQSASWLAPLSLHTISEQQSIQALATRLENGPLDPKRLILAFREPEIRQKLRPVSAFIDRFSKLGCRFALCDVGPEAQTESLVRHLQLDYLQLAPEAIQDLSEDEAVRHHLSVLSKLAGEAGAKVIAPPVENTGDLATLWQYGIVLVQGELIHDAA